MKWIEEFDGKNGDMMTMEEFIECVECGGFIDYDGFGNYSDGKYVIGGGFDVKPSMVKRKTLDMEWSHIVWYNR